MSKLILSHIFLYSIEKADFFANNLSFLRKVCYNIHVIGGQYTAV